MINDDSRDNQTPDRQDASTTQNETLEQRVSTLENCLEATQSRIHELESELTTLQEEKETLREENESLHEEVESLEQQTTRLKSLTEATRNRTGANKTRIEELQSRELEKGAHLRETNVDEHELDTDYLERLTKADGHTYYRLPDSDDPLDRTETTLAHGDLLPIQQLARFDEDMRRSTTNALPTRLAAKLWKARTDSTVGDDPWETGCKNIQEYVNAGDLKHWIRRQEDGVSDAYAKKLVSRTIDALLELSKHRLAVHRKTQRKNGLSYTERRLVLPVDADIPGERPTDENAPTPETADVHGGS